MERQYWAKCGRKVSGPHASREEALKAFIEEHGAKQRWRSVLTGYGTFGPQFDMQWDDLPKGE
jgi:hypothetical protein